jgi:hypothetical protein
VAAKLGQVLLAEMAAGAVCGTVAPPARLAVARVLSRDRGDRLLDARERVGVVDWWALELVVNRV